MDVEACIESPALNVTVLFVSGNNILRISCEMTKTNIFNLERIES